MLAVTNEAHKQTMGPWKFKLRTDNDWYPTEPLIKVPLSHLIEIFKQFVSEIINHESFILAEK